MQPFLTRCVCIKPLYDINMKTQFIICILFFITITKTQSFAQEQSATNSTLKFFLDCRDCDFDFVRQELKFVSFVRNPKLADVHILTTTSSTGSGGKKYFMNFIGLRELEGQNSEYEYYSEQTATSDERRKGLLKLIQTGILQYYSNTNFLDDIEINLTEKENRTVQELVSDPWNLWVYRISFGSDFEKEASQDEFSLKTNLDVRKVTEDWKLYLDANYYLNHENYYDNGEKIENNRNNSKIEIDYVKSLTSKWSAAIFGDYASSTYLNIKNEYSIAVAAEYNIFPWDISNEKVFTFRYRLGAGIYDYREETIYDKLNEILISQSLGFNLEMVQPWGRIEVWMEGRHYFHDFSKNRIALNSDFSIRLSKLISVYCGLGFQVVHDQLYLTKGDASREDLLLKRRKLATTYEMGADLGLRFTFGSIYNNVVNERF